MTQSLNSIPLYHQRNIEELRGRNDPEAIKAVAKEMESLFVYEMIKAMRETTETTSKKGLGGDVYLSMFDMELARLFAERGIGLQDVLLKGLNKKLVAGSKGPGDKEDKVSEIQRVRNSELPGIDSLGGAGQTPNSELSIPVDGIISSNFGMRKHPIYGHKRFHYGTDIAAPAGTGIYSIKRGKVIFSSEQSGYGNVVIIDHGNGLISKYAHNKINLVKEGDEVDTGTIIAEVGNTGKSTGPHLHFEVRDKGESIDPVGLLAKNEIKEF